MRKFFTALLLLGLFIGLTFFGSVQAKGSERSTLQQQANNVFTFSQLGASNHLLTAKVQGQPVASINYSVGGQQGLVRLQIPGSQATASLMRTPKPDGIYPAIAGSDI